MKAVAQMASVVVCVMMVAWLAPAEERSVAADLSYAELVSLGIINAYSTNVLVQQGFEGGSFSKADAEDAVRRNLAFVNVLDRYAQSLKRSTSTDDPGMKKWIEDMAGVATYLKQQTLALEDWLSDSSSASAKRLFVGYSDKVEARIETMLKGK